QFHQAKLLESIAGDDRRRHQANWRRTETEDEMSDRKFVIADVFTEKRFGGNQLAVFTDGVGLDSQTMQTIAREMHFSETTFLFPPEQGGDYKVRIFTPDQELPFAGHPIVGTAHAV